MATYVNTRIEDILLSRLDYRKYDLERMRWMAPAFVLMLTTLIGTGIVRWRTDGDLTGVLTSVFCLVAMLFPFQLLVRQYFGLTHPNFNYHKHKWALKKKRIAIGVRFDSREEAKSMIEQVRESSIKPENVYVTYVGGEYKGHENTWYFLFKHQKDAMLFKLMV